jgi:hypothetical protein
MEVGDVEHGLAEELVAALDSICSSPRWMAPTLAALMLPYSVVNSLRVLAHVLQHGPQVLQVQQQQAVGVGDLEDDLQHAGLRLVQVEHAGQQQRPHVGHRGAHRVALLAEHVPQRGGAGQRLGRRQAALLDGLGQLALDDAGWLMPVRSPLMSARNTGTPMRLKLSASFCRVTVLPVPVAPVTRPWRLASPGSRKASVLPFWAINSGSAMV